MLQLYIQQVINQTLATMVTSGEEGEGEGEEESVTAANTLQVRSRGELGGWLFQPHVCSNSS